MKKRMNWLLIGACLTLSLCWIGPVAAQVTIEVLNPRGELPPMETKRLSPRVPDLAGKKIALVANYKAGAELFLTKIEELLRQKFPTATILRFKIDKGFNKFADIAKQCDTFIHSTGD